MMCNEFVDHVLSVKINMIIIFEGVLLGCLRTCCAAGMLLMEVEEQVDISYEADLHESATWL